MLLGALAGNTSPVATHTPLIGAELVLDPRAGLTLDVAPDFEHGVLVDVGRSSSTAPSWRAPSWATSHPAPTG